jgi:mannan endo-1,4-beta-mannosidase
LHGCIGERRCHFRDFGVVNRAFVSKHCLAGLDYYGDDLGMKSYKEVASLGIPFGLGEVGPKRGSRGSFDYSRWIRAIRERYPATCYFQAWSWDRAMAAMGRDGLNWRGQY